MSGKTRRNLNDAQRVALAREMEPALKAQAKENERAGGGDRKSGSQNSANPVSPIDTRKAIAEAAGVSHDTVAKDRSSAGPELTLTESRDCGNDARP